MSEEKKYLFIIEYQYRGARWSHENALGYTGVDIGKFNQYGDIYFIGTDADYTKLYHGLFLHDQSFMKEIGTWQLELQTGDEKKVENNSSTINNLIQTIFKT